VQSDRPQAGRSAGLYRRLLLCWVEQRLHHEVTPLSPFGRSDVSESRRGQHQCRVAIREGSDHSCPPSGLADDPFEWIVGPDLPRRGIGIVGQSFPDPLLDELRGSIEVRIPRDRDQGFHGMVNMDSTAT
jgi:hypothetical protein